METASNTSSSVKLQSPDKQEAKDYAQPDVLNHTFELLSNLHKLLPNHLVEMLHSFRSREDKAKCEDSELSGLEKILARHQMPKEISLTPKPSRMPLWKRKNVNNLDDSWKKCHLLKRTVRDPPMCTIVVRWLKKNMQPTEDLKSVVQRLSEFGPIRSVFSCGRQSAVVVFNDTTSACKAVSAFQSRSPGTMFQCSWQHRFMSKDVRLSIAKNLQELFKVLQSFFIRQRCKTFLPQLLC